MKNLLALTLIIIIAAGNFIPCCISECSPEEICVDSQKQASHEEEDDCLPFFSCSCCHVSIVLTPAYSFGSFSTSISHSEKENFAILPTYSAFFWQPPRFI